MRPLRASSTTSSMEESAGWWRAWLRTVTGVCLSQCDALHVARQEIDLKVYEVAGLAVCPCGMGERVGNDVHAEA